MTIEDWQKHFKTLDEQGKIAVRVQHAQTVSDTLKQLLAIQLTDLAPWSSGNTASTPNDMQLKVHAGIMAELKSSPDIAKLTYSLHNILTRTARQVTPSVIHSIHALAQHYKQYTSERWKELADMGNDINDLRHTTQYAAINTSNHIAAVLEEIALTCKKGVGSVQR